MFTGLQPWSMWCRPSQHLGMNLQPSAGEKMRRPSPQSSPHWAGHQLPSQHWLSQSQYRARRLPPWEGSQWVFPQVSRTTSHPVRCKRHSEWNILES